MVADIFSRSSPPPTILKLLRSCFPINGEFVRILGEGPTDGLDNTIIKVEAKYFVTITKPRMKLCWSLHCNETNSYLCPNDMKIRQCKAMDSEIKPYILCLGKISNSLALDNMKKKKKNGMNGLVYNFFFNYQIADVSDITDIHKHLMKKQNIV